MVEHSKGGADRGEDLPFGSHSVICLSTTTLPGFGNAQADRDGDESDEDDEAEGGDADQGVQVDLLRAEELARVQHL